jgi:hypothetical protein
MTLPNDALTFPNFLIVGAMKGGTTSLYHYLRSHPQIFMPTVKELDFFVKELNWSRGLSWYRRHFQGLDSSVVAAGEASTNYTKYPRYQGVPARIASTFPTARLIYVIRHPIERMRSHYQHSVAVGLERKPIEEALLTEPSYLNCSKYGSQIQQYVEYFPLNQLLIVTSEALRDQREETMRRLYRFLNVDGAFTPSNLQHEFYKTAARRKYSPRLASVRKMLKKRWPESKILKEMVDTLGRERLASSRFRLNRARSPTHRLQSPMSVIPADTRSVLESMLREDIELLLRYMPEGFHAWGLR